MGFSPNIPRDCKVVMLRISDKLVFSLLYIKIWITEIECWFVKMHVVDLIFVILLVLITSCCTSVNWWNMDIFSKWIHVVLDIISLTQLFFFAATFTFSKGWISDCTTCKKFSCASWWLETFRVCFEPWRTSTGRKFICLFITVKMRNILLHSINKNPLYCVLLSWFILGWPNHLINLMPKPRQLA